MSNSNKEALRDVNGLLVGRRMKRSNLRAKTPKLVIDLLDWCGCKSFVVVRPEGLKDSIFFGYLGADYWYKLYILGFPDGQKFGLAWCNKSNRFLITDDYNKLKYDYLDVLKILHRYCYEKASLDFLGCRG